MNSNPGNSNSYPLCWRYPPAPGMAYNQQLLPHNVNMNVMPVAPPLCNPQVVPNAQMMLQNYYNNEAIAVAANNYVAQVRNKNKRKAATNDTTMVPKKRKADDDAADNVGSPPKKKGKKYYCNVEKPPTILRVPDCAKQSQKAGVCTKPKNHVPPSHDHEGNNLLCGLIEDGGNQPTAISELGNSDNEEGGNDKNEPPIATQKRKPLAANQTERGSEIENNATGAELEQDVPRVEDSVDQVGRGDFNDGEGGDPSKMRRQTESMEEMSTSNDEIEEMLDVAPADDGKEERDPEEDGEDDDTESDGEDSLYVLKEAFDRVERGELSERDAAKSLGLGQLCPWFVMKYKRYRKTGEYVINLRDREPKRKPKKNSAQVIDKLKIRGAELESQLMKTATARLEERQAKDAAYVKLNEVTKKLETTESLWRLRMEERENDLLSELKAKSCVIEELRGENESLRHQLELKNDSALCAVAVKEEELTDDEYIFSQWKELKSRNECSVKEEELTDDE